jgi:hypothetical protein
MSNNDSFQDRWLTATHAEGAEMEAKRIAQHVRRECNLPDKVTFR